MEVKLNLEVIISNSKSERPIATYHTDRTEVSSFGFGKNPDSRVSSSNDHHSRL